jgi:hypothetical protein
VRSKGEDEWQAWEDACAAWHGRVHPTDSLWENAFLDRLRTGDRAAIEDALLFLEVDPWYFRSGYLKERLIGKLKGVALQERDKERLRVVIWHVAKGRNRREFRDFCSLARCVATSEFRRRLSAVPADDDRQASGKFSYLRKYLDEHMNGGTEQPDARDGGDTARDP